jgi:hypothetical protein
MSRCASKSHARRHKWCRMSDSNRRPTAYKAVALPTELIRHDLYSTSLCVDRRRLMAVLEKNRCPLRWLLLFYQQKQAQLKPMLAL